MISSHQIKNCAYIKYILFWGLLLCFHSLQAQKGRDNYRQSKTLPTIQDNNLEQVKDDTLTVLALIERVQAQAKKHSYANLDTVLQLKHQALAIAKNINYVRGITKIYEALVWTYYCKGQNDSAIYYLKVLEKQASLNCDIRHLRIYNQNLGMNYQAALKFDSAIVAFQNSIQYAKEQNDTIQIQGGNSSLAQVYYIKGDFLSAAKYCFENEGLTIIRKDTYGLIWNYGLLGSIFSDMNLMNKEINLVHKALHMVRNSKDSSLLFLAYLNASNGYLNQHQYDSVFYYGRKLEIIARKRSIFPFTWWNIGQAFLGANNIDSAEYYFVSYLKEFQSNNVEVDPNLYLSLGQCAVKKGNYPQALKYYRLVENNIENKAISTRRDLYRSLYEYYDTLKLSQPALLYFKKYKTIEDSLISNQITFNIGTTEMENAAEKMESEIQILTLDNELQIARTSRQRQQKHLLFGGTAFLFLLGILGFIRFKKQKDFKNKQALLNERLRISRELHDEVGATLSGIAMYSHVAREQVKNVQSIDADHSLSIMQKSAGEMVSKLSDIVWLINPEQDTISELFDRLEEYARQMAPLRNMQVQMDLPIGLSSIHLPLEARRNIYLFCKEAINNAVKYSNGRSLELLVKDEGNKLRFSVIDDGMGFDEMTVRRGNGLDNMRRRAEEIGALFQFTSSQGRGTRIELQYKLST